MKKLKPLGMTPTRYPAVVDTWRMLWDMPSRVRGADKLYSCEGLAMANFKLFVYKRVFERDV